MAGGAALSPSLQPPAPAPAPQPQQQQAKEQLQKAVAMNGLRLQAIGDRIKVHFRGGHNTLPSSDLNHLVYAFARGIDYALSGGDVPKIAAEIPDTMRKVYQLRNDPYLQSSVMILIISCKNACKNKWFQPADYIDILRMADEISGNFCTPVSQANDNTVLEIISTVMPRYYPKLKFDRLVTSLEAKVGYDILMADFFIHRNLPKNEKISLIVVQKENLDVSSCIATPPHVSFLVNGKGVDKRTNVSLETGAQFPTDITKMLKYGANILQAVGYFNANYIIAVAFVNNLMSSDAPKLNDYAQPVTADLPDSDILEGPSRVSLKCPISFRRMKTPVKGQLCKHHQCFDYDNYMEMNLKKPTWRCPFCNTPSNFIDLRNDQKMAKVLQETSDDIIDILVFPDGSWKAIHDEKSDKNRHAGDMIQQNGDTVDTDATISEVIDLVNKDDDGDLPMSLASTPEDLKPVLNSPDLSVMDYLADFPVSTTAQSEDLYVGGGNNGSSNGTSTSGQNLLLSSTSGPSSSSFGTLESILPRDIMQMQPATRDAASPSFGTPNLTFAMQQISQGAYPNIMHTQSQLDSQHRSEVARHAIPSIPRNVRREPIAIQALAVPQQNSSRRVHANVLNPPSPNPQSISASSNYQAHHVTNVDSVITSMINGVGPLSRAPDGSPSLHQQLTQQDMRNMPNHARGRVMGLAAPPFVHMRPPTGVPGQGRGANAHGAPFPQQYQHLDQRQIDNLMGQFISQVGAVSQGMPSNLFAPQQSQALRSQAVSRPGTPPVQPRVQSPGLPQTAPATPLVESSDAPELQMDPNWQPTGRMRGSLVGPAYDQAIGRYLQPGGERTSQAQPPGR
nr:E4 SUMO-protein ligase PIAL2-like isoform X3 [Lolium perenne]